MKNLKDAINHFITAAQAVVDAGNLGGDRRVLRAVPAGRYVRVEIAFKDGGSRAAYCFIDESGNILRATSLKGPTKHVRGNVFDPNPVSGVGPHGANYA
jgi:hypothetical protein